MSLRSGFKVSARHIVDGAQDYAVACKSQRLLLLCAGGDMLKVFALHKHSHSFWKDEAAATTAAATGATGAAKGGATPAPAPAPTLAQEDEDCARHTNHSHADTLSLTASAVANAASEEEDAEDGCVQLTYELFFHTSVDIGHWHTLECTPAMSCVRVVCVCVSSVYHAVCQELCS
jgi:hypothetical protein